MSAELDDDLLAVRARLGWSSGAVPGQCCAVVGYDGSSSSAAALAYAGGWAQRNLGAVVIVHVDAAAAGMMMAQGACAMTGVVPLEIPQRDMSTDVEEAMTYVSTRWAYLNVSGDVADQLERIAGALAADVIVVGRSRRPRLRIASSVARRLLGTSRHIIIVV
ncbi:MAG TPA: universal stress protein [Jatrophihabitans sp.]|nr:universal stress protein [Jatrophihabitans sp.]